MINIKRNYHFYAAHRNHELKDKCSNIHGHTYFVEIDIEFPDPFNSSSGVTMLFSEIDNIVQPIINEYDHALMICIEDPLFKVLRNSYDVLGLLKMVKFVQPTSVEILCVKMYNQIESTGLKIKSIEIKETLSATVRYEWQKEKEYKQSI